MDNSLAPGMQPLEICWHEKNYLPDCTAGEYEGKPGYFQCAVHLAIDK